MWWDIVIAGDDVDDADGDYDDNGDDRILLPVVRHRHSWWAASRLRSWSKQPNNRAY